MTLILRKLLASSTFAIAGALDSLARKLERQLKEGQAQQDQPAKDLSNDFDRLHIGSSKSWWSR